MIETKADCNDFLSHEKTSAGDLKQVFGQAKSSDNGCSPILIMMDVDSSTIRLAGFHALVLPMVLFSFSLNLFQQHGGRFIIRILRNQFSAKGFCQNGLGQLIDMCFSFLVSGLNLISKSK
jgi:hypothetical protein